MSEVLFPPRFSCDCHAHVVGPKSRYPLTSPWAYTPMDAPLEALEAMVRWAKERTHIVLE